MIEEAGLNKLTLAKKAGGLGIIASGVAAAYLEEGFETAALYGLQREELSILTLKAASPLPEDGIRKMLASCQKIVVLEELEPLVENGVYVEAQKMGYKGQIFGKRSGVFSRVGEYGVKQVIQGIEAALNLNIPADLYEGNAQALSLAAARPITVCAGCPHRGTYMAINKAVKKSGFKKNEVMVTGDIGCTILGMNPPFDTIWNEVSMGASISLAQGFVHAGTRTPVLATIGDSTFFHGGIPGLVNAIQHQVDLTLIIMDNRWTAMTGMQVNPGTPCAISHKPYLEVDIARIIPALGVEQFWMIDPFKFEESTAVIAQAMALPGVKVILARQECAIQAQRQGKQAGKVHVIEENCNLCKLCLLVTGCPALSLGASSIQIDPELCYGCGMCVQTCNKAALVKEAA